MASIVSGRLVGSRWVDLTKLLKLLTGGHLLGEQSGLDAMKKPLQPTHQLSLSNSQLALAGDVI
jgi:hypothetical protein